MSDSSQSPSSLVLPAHDTSVGSSSAINQLETEDKKEGQEAPAKLFIGQIPRHIVEADLRRLFEPFGPIQELVILRDKHTNAHRGCAFLTYTNRSSADKAINNVHEKISLHNRPIVVRYAGAANQPVETKLFVGMLARSTSEQSIEALFSKYGSVKEVYLMRDQNQQSKGCAFVKMNSKEDAVQAISELNEQYQDEGAPRKLVVRFADSKATKPHAPGGVGGAMAGAGGAGAGGGAGSSGQWNQWGPVPVNPYAPFGNRGLGVGVGVNGVGLAGLSAHHAAMGSHLPHHATHLGALNRLGLPQFANQFNNLPYGYPDAANFQPNAAFQQQAAAAAFQQQAGQFGQQGVYDLQQQQGHGHGHGHAHGHGHGQGGGSSQGAGVGAGAPVARGPPGSNLFVYNIPETFTDVDLSQLFSSFGHVVSTKVYRDKVTGMSRGFGFVSYDSSPSAEKAIQGLNGFHVGNKRLKVMHKKNHDSGGGNLNVNAVGNVGLSGVGVGLGGVQVGLPVGVGGQHGVGVGVGVGVHPQSNLSPNLAPVNVNALNGTALNAQRGYNPYQTQL